MLIALSGLPGVGKTSIARGLAAQLHAIHLRIDSIEAAMKRSTLAIHPAADAGYLAAIAIAHDSLALGHIVVADAVNPIALSRRWWADCAKTAETPLVNVEVICSDEREHRRRVESRKADIAGLTVPDWREVQRRTFEAWTTTCIQIDTAGRSTELSVAELLRQLPDVRP